MEINKKSGIYKIEGEFQQNGVFGGNNSFYGYVELEDDVYIYNDPEVGKVKLVYFKGIQKDNYDEQKKSRLVLGGLQVLEGMSTIFFRKFVNNSIMLPVSYGLKAASENVESFYVGDWYAMDPFFAQPFERASIKTFKELTKEEVASQGVREFLDKGYAETNNLPALMQAEVNNFNKEKETIKKLSDRVELPKQKGE